MSRQSSDGSGGDEGVNRIDDAAQAELFEFFSNTQQYQQSMAEEGADEDQQQLLNQFLALGLEDKPLRGEDVQRLRPIIEGIRDHELASEKLTTRVLNATTITKKDLGRIGEALGYSFGDTVAEITDNDDASAEFKREIEQEELENAAEAQLEAAEKEEVRRQLILAGLGRNDEFDYPTDVRDLEDSFLANTKDAETKERLEHAYERATVANGSVFFRESKWGELENALFSENTPTLEQVVASPAFDTVRFYKRDGNRGIPVTGRPFGDNVYCSNVEAALFTDGEQHTDIADPVWLSTPDLDGMLSGTTMQPAGSACYPVSEVARAVRAGTKEVITQYLAVKFQSTGAVVMETTKRNNDFSRNIEDLDTPFVNSAKHIIELYKGAALGDESDDESDDEEAEYDEELGGVVAADEDETDEDETDEEESDEEYDHRQRCLRLFQAFEATGTGRRATLECLRDYNNKRIGEWMEEYEDADDFLPGMFSGTTMKPFPTTAAKKQLEKLRKNDGLLAQSLGDDSVANDNMNKIGAIVDYPFSTIAFLRALHAHQVRFTSLSAAREVTELMDDPISIDNDAIAELEPDFPSEVLALVRELYRRMSGVELPDPAAATPSAAIIGGIDSTRRTRRTVRETTEFTIGMLASYQDIMPYTEHKAVVNDFPAVELEFATLMEQHGDLSGDEFLQLWMNASDQLQPAFGFDTYGPGDKEQMKEGLTQIYEQAIRSSVAFQQDVIRNAAELAADRLLGAVDRTPVVLEVMGIEEFAVYGTLVDPTPTSRIYVGNVATIGSALVYVHNTYSRGDMIYVQFSNNVGSHPNVSPDYPEDMDYLQNIKGTRVVIMPRVYTRRVAQSARNYAPTGVVYNPAALADRAWVDYAGDADLVKVTSATGARADSAVHRMTVPELQELIRFEGKTVALLTRMKMRQLKALLRLEDKNVGGNRSQLIERLISGKPRHKSPPFVPDEWDDDDWVGWANPETGKPARATEAKRGLTDEEAQALVQTAGKTQEVLKQLNVRQLKALLRSEGKPLGGKRQQLIDRLLGISTPNAGGGPARARKPAKKKNTARETRIASQLDNMCEALVEYPIREICREFNLSIPELDKKKKKATSTRANGSDAEGSDAESEDDTDGEGIEEDSGAEEEAEDPDTPFDELELDDQFEQLKGALDAGDVDKFYILLEDAEPELAVEKDLTDAAELVRLLTAAHEEASNDDDESEDETDDSDDEGDNTCSQLDSTELTTPLLLDCTINALAPANNAIVAVIKAGGSSKKLNKLAHDTIGTLENALNTLLQPNAIRRPWRHTEFGRKNAVMLWDDAWWLNSYGCMQTLASKGNLSIANLTPDELLDTINSVLDQLAFRRNVDLIDEMQKIMKFTNMLKILEASLISRAVAVFGGEDYLGGEADNQFKYHSWTSTRLDFVRAFMGKITDTICGRNYSRTGSVYSSTARKKLARWQDVLRAWGVKEPLPPSLFAESVRMVFFPQLGYYPASMDADSPILKKLPKYTDMWRYQIYESRAFKLKEELSDLLASRRAARDTAGGYTNRAMRPAQPSKGHGTCAR
jgi:phage tail protein X